MQDPAIGKEVDGYRIEEVLGRGGMGVVYKAEDLALARPVALKLVNPSLGNRETLLQRFRSEAQALARIDSRNIVRVHALRETELGLVIVMEYVEGHTLGDELLQQQRMDWPNALPVLRQTLLALHHAHEAGVTHRDVKPGNIMITPAGEVKVADFGLAKILDPDRTMTMTQGVAGTLRYMSPEQVETPADVDQRSDLYSLAMVGYEMLTGQLPFDQDGSALTIMRTIVEQEVPDARTRFEDLPEELADFLAKALRTDPDERFDDAGAMIEALDTFASGREETLAEVQAVYGSSVSYAAPSFSGRSPLSPSQASSSSGKLYDQKTIIEAGQRPAPSPTVLEAESQGEGTTEESTGGGGVLTWLNDAQRFSWRRALIAAVLLVGLLGTAFSYSYGWMSAPAGDGAPSEASVPARPTQSGNAQTPSMLSPSGAGGPNVAELGRPGGSPQAGTSAVGGTLRDSAPPPAAAEAPEGDPLPADASPPREAPPQQQPAPSPATGQVSVVSDPAEAQAYLDGEPIGSTPSSAQEVPPGRHTLVLQKESHRADTVQLDVRAGQSVSVQRQLQPLVGTLAVRVRPASGSRLYVDGEPQGGNQEQYRLRVPAGTRRVQLTHPAFGNWKRSVTVQPAQSRTIDVNFEASLRVNVTAFDSDGQFVRGPIYVNGRSTGHETPRQLSLDVGQYRIAVRKEGYRQIALKLDGRVVSQGTGPISFDQRQSGPLTVLLEAERPEGDDTAGDEER